jgi:hypothetical protein
VSNLDLFVHADQSRSISIANPSCKAVNNRTCWQSEVDFINGLQAQVASQVGGYYDPATGAGLRFWLSTFSCLNGLPITKIITQLTGNPTAISRALGHMSGMQPLYGTCPSQGLDDIHKAILAVRDDVRVNQAVLIVTDGRVAQTDITKSNNAAFRILLSGASMNAATVGEGINTRELLIMVGGNSERIVSVNSFPTLAEKGPKLVSDSLLAKLGYITNGTGNSTAKPPGGGVQKGPGSTSAPSISAAPSPTAATDGATAQPTAADAPAAVAGASAPSPSTTTQIVAGTLTSLFALVGALALGVFVRRRRTRQPLPERTLHEYNDSGALQDARGLLVVVAAGGRGASPLQARRRSRGASAELDGAPLPKPPAKSAGAGHPVVAVPL